MSYSKAKEISRIYDARANIQFDGSTYNVSVSRDLATLYELVGGTPTSLCDVGCGCGWHLEKLAERGVTNLWGIDLSAGSLSAFFARTDIVRSGAVKVILGDVLKWQGCELFSVVTAFLACIGRSLPRGDIEYLCSLQRLIQPGGTLLVSTFCFDNAHNVVGDWKSSFTSEGCQTVRTIVTLESGSNLKISQEIIGSDIEIPDEYIHLYKREELEALAEAAGLCEIHVFPAVHSDQVRDSPIAYLMGRKKKL